MRTDILVSLLVSRVFRDKVEVLSSNDDGSLHLGTHNDTGKNSSTNGHRGRGEGTFLVNVCTFDSLGRRLETEAYFTVPTLQT